MYKIGHMCDIAHLRSEFYKLGVLNFMRPSILTCKAHKLGVLIYSHREHFRRVWRCNRTLFFS